METLTIEQMKELKTLGDDGLGCSMTYCQYHKYHEPFLINGGFYTIQENSKFYLSDIGSVYTADNLIKKIENFYKVWIEYDGQTNEWRVKTYRFDTIKKSLLDALFNAYKYILKNK